MRLSELSRYFTEIIRDGNFSNLGFPSHQSKDMLVFIENEVLIEAVNQSKNVTCVITKPDLALKIAENFGCALAESPRNTFFRIHAYLANETDFYWQPFPTSIDPTARIHPRATVATTNVRIGSGTIVEANATILERCIIGRNVIIRSGAVVGSEGFQFERTATGIIPIPHGGGVLVEDNVEIQANATIDRALFGGYTRIGTGTKIADLVHVAHNVSIGHHCLIGAHATINGSTLIGDDVWIGPGAIISNGLTIGNQASVTLGAVVVRNVSPGQRVTGYYAIEHWRFRDWFKQFFPEV